MRCPNVSRFYLKMLLKLGRMSHMKACFIVNILIVLSVIVVMYMFLEKETIIEISRVSYEKIIGRCEIYTYGCRIRYMESNDPKMIRDYGKPEAICPMQSKPRLVEVKNNFLYVSKEAVKFYTSEPSLDKLECCYRTLDPKYTFTERKICFKDKVEAEGEFLKVTCSMGQKRIYSEYFTILYPVPKLRPVKYDKSEEDHKPEYNVLVLGIDTISRLSFRRNFPMSFAFLKDLGVLEFSGYQKTGQNRINNQGLLNLLSGYSGYTWVYMMKQECFGHYFQSPCPLIWKKFGKKGYRTGYAEDLSYLGPFHEENKDLNVLPADHYWGPINAKNFLDNYDTSQAEPVCLGSSPAYLYLFDYIEQFIDLYLNKERFFGFFWSYSLSYNSNHTSHQDDLNLSKFLKRLHSKGIFKNTFVFMLSSQGDYFDKYLQYPELMEFYAQAKLEASLPLLLVNTPTEGLFEERARKNMESNTKRLITVVDIYRTLKAISSGHYGPRKFPKKNIEKNLFYPVSPDRSCISLSIPENICACEQF